ncbi:hypothetical protein [Vibrio phage LP.1]|nr:hypothetical protein [Vibrio phage LP.1]
MNITKQIATWLLSQGVFDQWTDEDGVLQPAFKLQRDELDETRIADSDRFIYIGQVGSSGDRYTASVPVAISFIGKVAANDRAAIKEYCERIFNLMLDYPLNDECIVSIEPLGYVNGPMKMESGRNVYDFEVQVNYQTGKVDS